MIERAHYNPTRWASLLAAAILLAFCLILVGSQMAAAQDPATQRLERDTPLSRPIQTSPRAPIAHPAPASLMELAQAQSVIQDAPDAGLPSPGAVQGGPAERMMPLGQPLPNPGFTVDLTYDALYGIAGSGDLVTVTRSAGGAAYGTGQADGAGFFWTNIYEGSLNGRPADVAGGDGYEVYVNGVLAATIDAEAITGEVDVVNDQVMGNVTGLAAGTEITVTLGEQGYMIADEPRVVTSLDGVGDFVADFSAVADIGPHMMAQVAYRDDDGNTVLTYLYPSEVFRILNYSSVQGYAEPGSVVTTTVYNLGSTDPLSSATGWANWPHGWYNLGVRIDADDVVEVELQDGPVLAFNTDYFEARPDASTEQVTGMAPAGASVRAHLWSDFDGQYTEGIDDADGSGNYAISLAAADLETRHWVYAGYADAEGDELGLLAAAPHIRAYLPWWSVYAVAPGPHMPVTYTLMLASGTFTETRWCGWSNACDVVDGYELQPGDAITAEFPHGGSMSMVVSDISVGPDTGGDAAAGAVGEAGFLEATACQWYDWQYPAHSCGLTSGAISGNYSLHFESFDVRDSMSAMYVYFYDAVDGHRTFNWWGSPYWETPFFEVNPPYGVGGAAHYPDEHLVARLYDTDGTTILAETGDDQNGDPWWFWFGDFQGEAILPGRWVEVIGDSGWVGSMQVPTLTLELDAGSGLASGDAPPSQIVLEYNTPWGGDARAVPVHEPTGSYVLDVVNAGGSLDPGSSVSAVYQASDGNRVRQSARLGELFRVEFWLEPSGPTSMWGEAQAGEMVTITTPYTEVHAYADPGCNGCWDAFVGDLYPGEPVTIMAGPGSDPLYVTIADPLTANADSDADEVSGQIGGWGDRMVEVHGEWDDGYREAATDSNGNYSAGYGDVPRGGRGYVRWETMEGYTQVVFHRPFQAPDLLLNVNYAHDWVEGNYEPGYTVWLTVTDGYGNEKATIQLETQVIPWWGGQSGFSTNVEGAVWDPELPDIVEGDWVYGRVDRDEGYNSSVRIGTIAGTLDINGNSIAGNIWADFAEMLNGNCGIWEEGGPGEGFMVDPYGGYYFCDFGAMGWDLQPGHNVGVQYQEPDGDWVINVFREPSADLAVDKNGQAQPAPAGNYVYRINYYNNGDGVAGSARLTDTLPTGMAYLTDTSGLQHDGGGTGPIVWELGEVLSYTSGFFDVFVSVDDGLSPGERLTNTVDIGSPSFDSDPANNHHEWGVDVAGNDTHLNIGKWAWTGDPAPGQEVVFTVNPCNNGGTASSQVTLTDTLDPPLILEQWWSDEAGWAEDSGNDHELVLSRPSIAGGTCSPVYVRASVDEGASPGMPITNTATITASNDLEGDDNVAPWSGNLGDPHPNLSIGKWFNGGRLVPGGELQYGIGYNNDGNVPLGTFTITDTLPAGTTFREWGQGGGPVPATLVGVYPGYVVWQVDGMPNGFSGDLWFTLDVDDGATPGTVLTNTAEASRLPGEDSYDDNVATSVEQLSDPGPNLRVSKWSQWNGDGQLEYRIQFRNIGDETISNVWLTDTLPVSTTWEGWWNLWFDWNRVSAESLSGDLLKWQFSELYPGDSGEIGFAARLDEPGTPWRWYTNIVEIDTPPGDTTPDDNTYTRVDFSGPDLQSVDLDVYRSRIWGCARSTPITVTTALAEVVYGDNCWDDYSFPDTFDPGDVVTITTPNSPQPVVAVVPDPFTAFVSGDEDRVWGQIDALAFEPVGIDVWGLGSTSVKTNGSGQYEAVFDELPRGARGDVNYSTEIDYTPVTFHRRMDSLDLVLNLDYDSEFLWGNYAADHTIWITVTESSGTTVKGTQTVTSWLIPWWGEAGWEIDGQAWDPGPGVDIQPFDWVFARSDTGATAEVQVGEITGNVESANDTIAGTVLADWWLSAGELHVQCNPYWGPNQEDGVLPNGTDPYTCSWDPMNEWDVLPGDNITVQYWEPDGDMVQANFHEPAPNVNLEKWADGSGKSYPGGPVVFSIRVQNHGEAVADPVIVTDTLPSNAVYVDDSAPTAPTFPGGQPVWDLGPLEPGAEVQFFVYLQNTAEAGETVHNVADAWAPDDQDPGNNHAEAEVLVSDELPDLYVNKNPDPGDPAAGQSMLWYVDYGNNGPVASGPVELIDTLPDATTVVEWWSENGLAWNEVAVNGQLRLEAPSIPGQWGDRLNVRLALDPGLQPGTQLTNTVEIVTDPDADPGNNWHQRDDVWVGESRLNAGVDKWFGWGSLVAGGEAGWGIHVRNSGNTAISTTLTDVLPSGTSFREAWMSDGRNRYEAPPDEIDGNTLTWYLGELQPAEYRNLDLSLDIDPGLGPSSVLTNCAQVSIEGDDSWPYDDESCAAVTVREPGANLRVAKDYSWNGDGQLQYQITFYNVGTVTLNDVVIADTLPDGTHFNGNWWSDFWEGLDKTFDDGSHLEWTVSRLEPGWSASITFQADLDLGGVEGLAYTNLVEAPIEGDIWPEDNSAEVTAYTGPDVFVEKWLSGGEPRPGEVVTFTVEFGNKNRWPWNGDDQVGSHITETLPAGMTFITATAPWNPDEVWQPEIVDGNTIVWGWGTMWADNWWRFDIAVEIDETAVGGEVLINTIEAKGDSPDDVEPDYGNNVFELPVTILAPVFDVSKAYESSRVAGTVVTYTLSVANNGNAEATGVVLSDTLPGGLTYLGSNGSYDGSDVTWSIAALAAGGGSTERWFSAELPCQAGQAIVNSQYGVVQSDQGVGAWGSTVSFTTLAPNIQVSLAFAPELVLVGETVYFTATATTDGTGLTYEWDFGEGPLSGGLTVSRAFAAADSYEVSFTATDACGFSESALVTIQVEEAIRTIYLPIVVKNH